MQAIHQHQRQQNGSDKKDADAGAKQQYTFFDLVQFLVHLKLSRLGFLAEEGFCISGNPTQQGPDARLWRRMMLMEGTPIGHVHASPASHRSVLRAKRYPSPNPTSSDCIG